MTLLGRWRIVEMADYEDDFPDMMEPAYILFDRGDGGEFAFGCVTGQLHNRPAKDRASFTWQGNDEMDEASGDGWTELQPDGSLKGEIRFHNGDDAKFVARPWDSSTAC